MLRHLEQEALHTWLPKLGVVGETVVRQAFPSLFDLTLAALSQVSPPPTTSLTLVLAIPWVCAETL